MPGIVARVRPRASKGITDLLLLSVSDGFRAVDPSKKTYSISGGLGVCTTQGLPGIRDERKDTPTPKRRSTSHPHREQPWEDTIGAHYSRIKIQPTS